jgi:4-amino-4-deoxychorismate lyase
MEYHNFRFNYTRQKFFGIKESGDIRNMIEIPELEPHKIYKCRLTYSENIIQSEFEIYKPRQIKSLRMITCNDIEYDFKFSDRSYLNKLFTRKGNCDDILIIKNGLITDTSIANIVFFDGVKWITPISPLLNGTARRRLLNEGKISEMAISPGDIKKFTRAKMINAMTDFIDFAFEIPVSYISWGI